MNLPFLSLFNKVVDCAQLKKYTSKQKYWSNKIFFTNLLITVSLKKLCCYIECHQIKKFCLPWDSQINLANDTRCLERHYQFFIEFFFLYESLSVMFLSIYWNACSFLVIFNLFIIHHFSFKRTMILIFNVSKNRQM